MNINYYKSILGQWRGIEDHAAWLDKRCDSRLEVFTGLAVLGIFQRSADDCGWDSGINLEGDHIRLSDPYAISPTGNGVSVAFLTCQFNDVHNWDFCIHTGADNGDAFGDSSPSLLVDIDGYGVHSKQRKWDTEKTRLATIPAIRICEERFKDHWQMAWAIMWSSMFSCGCEYSGSLQPDCEFHNDISARIVTQQ